MKTFYKAILMTAVVMTVTACKNRSEKQESMELFPDGKPLGQPYCTEMDDIRMVRVSSVNEADSFFILLSRNSGFGNVRSYHLPDGDSIWLSRNERSGSEMLYTHRTLQRTYEVGIIYIQDPAINSKGIREVHFVETIKRKGVRKS